MKSLDKEFKRSFKSVAEVYYLMRELEGDTQRAGMRLATGPLPEQSKKITLESITNAIYAWMLSLDRKDQMRIIDAGLARLNCILREEEWEGDEDSPRLTPEAVRPRRHRSVSRAVSDSRITARRKRNA